MRDSNINLSRLIIIILLLPAYRFVNAQSSTEPPESSYGPYSDFNPSMAVLFLVLIFAFFFVGFCSVYITNCYEPTSPAAGTIPPSTSKSRRRGLDQASIEKFPIFVYSAVKEIKIGRGALECAVCLSEFEDDDTLRLLPKCDHVFHPDCIDAWLASHVTCPVCRANLTLDSSEQQISESNNQDNEITNNNNNPPNEIVINVNEDGERRARISGKFPRSHSTGHSTESYTLRLPEEIRKQMILIANTKLKRTMSFSVVLTREGSSRKGYRNGGEEKSFVDRQSDRFDRWVSKVGSVKSTKVSSPC